MRPTIQGIKSRMPFASPIKWNLVSIQSASADFPDMNSLNLQCISVTLPKLTEQPMEVNIRGMQVRQPGIYQFDKQISIQFIESVDNLISEWWHNWKELCWGTAGKDITGQQYAKQDLEATLLLQRLDHLDTPIFQYELFGCYPNDDDFGTLDATTTDALMPTLTINYDYFLTKTL